MARYDCNRSFKNQGRHQVTIVKVGRFNADCDLNHPFAGKTLTFDVEVINVRQATAEELSHGHVHGEGGCATATKGK